MRKLMMAAGLVSAVCMPFAAQAYNLSIVDEMSLYINNIACMEENNTGPVMVGIDVSPNGDGRRLNLILNNQEVESLDCFEFEIGPGGPGYHAVTAGLAGGSGPGTITPAATSAEPLMVFGGQRAHFTLNPGDGYHVGSVQGCGNTGSGASFTTGVINADCHVTVNFVATPPQQYTATPSVSGAGTISPSGPQTVNQGAVVSFTLTPADGETIESATGCGGSLSGNTFTTAAMSGNCAVNITFSSPSPGDYDLSHCGGSWPGSVTEADVIDLSGSLPQITVDMVGTRTYANPVRSLPSNTVRGNFSYGAVMGTTHISRQVWLARCPGVAYDSPHTVCRSQGTEAVNINWANFNRRGSCQISPDTQYFLHYRTTNCGSATNCRSYRTIQVSDG